MSNHEFEYHPEAIVEAWEALHWYAERNETVADNFWDELRVTRQLVAEHPGSWTPYLHGTRILQLKRFPYGLVYIERGDQIIGIAVAHLKRRPGYWRKRLAE
jgi:plasmid stabilization system protein ParE